MPEAKFLLKEPTSIKRTLVYLFYNFDRQRLKFSTGTSVCPLEWNAEKQRALEGKKYPLNGDLNQRLNEIETAVGRSYYRLQNLGQLITPATLKAELEKELTGKQPTTKPTTLIDFAERYIEEVAGHRAPGTLQVYRSTIQHLRDFQKHSRRTYDFANVTLDFYHNFTEYLTNTKGHTNNTVGKVIKTVKSFLTEAAERKLHTNTDYKSKRFQVLKEETEAVYLTVAELETLASLALPEGSSIADVRDIFVFGAFTGLRFSDLSKLAATQVSITTGGKMLKVRTQKTDTTVVIPLHPIAEAILARNQGHPPKAYSNARTNALLKELGKRAGLTAPIEVSTAKGKLRATVVRQKWEMITTHTARRSFATNAYLAGIPLPAIMSLTGHSKTQTFLSYIRITAEENATQLLSHSFFQPTNILGA
jgi:site-specific recombinase XerD